MLLDGKADLLTPRQHALGSELIEQGGDGALDGVSRLRARSRGPGSRAGFGWVSHKDEVEVSNELNVRGARC